MILEKYPDADITLINSYAASYGLGMLVERAASYIKNETDKDTIIEKINEDLKQIRHLFTVNDLNYRSRRTFIERISIFR